ncbi:hypothetical protein PV328_010380 [Microctonus aethiopoides]|uniref:Endonuclease/exonuclease/phosphatase domain-containing protein n=1 Tax=Microctonus aethiopoides TaxID=144406 RepID=A0AA39FHS0_9HYME|nr:hypothetical protein PV328_010380 [Microctonus aethiopoides]
MNFENKGLETIIAGDFNAHNTLWNCQNTDSNGEILFEIKNNKDILSSNSVIDNLDETGFLNDLTDIFNSEIIVKADFVHHSTFTTKEFLEEDVSQNEMFQTKVLY